VLEDGKNGNYGLEVVRDHEDGNGEQAFDALKVEVEVEDPVVLVVGSKAQVEEDAEY